MTWRRKANALKDATAYVVRDRPKNRHRFPGLPLSIYVVSAFALAACAGPDMGPCSIAAAKTALADSLAWEISERRGRALDLAGRDQDAALALDDSAAVLLEAWEVIDEAQRVARRAARRAVLGDFERRWEARGLTTNAEIDAYYRERDSILAANPVGSPVPPPDVRSLFAAADSLRDAANREIRSAGTYAVVRASDVDRLRLEAAEAGLLCEGR